MPTLQVIVQEASGLPPKIGSFDKTDPFVILQIGASIFKTDVKKNAGSSAVYNRVFAIPYEGEPQLIVYVKDSDKGDKGRLIGTGVINLASGILANGTWEGVVPMVPTKVFSGKCSPSVALKIELRP